MTKHLKRMIVVILTLILGLTLGGSALAAGGPGTPPPPMNFARGAISVSGGNVVITGTVTCDLPGWAAIGAGVEQAVGKAGMVSGGTGQYVDCPEPGTHDVELVVEPNVQRGFRPGAATIYLEFDYTAQLPNGDYTGGNMFGILFEDLRPA
jgi:hypothetical protein